MGRSSNHPGIEALSPQEPAPLVATPPAQLPESPQGTVLRATTFRQAQSYDFLLGIDNSPFQDAMYLSSYFFIISNIAKQQTPFLFLGKQLELTKLSNSHQKVQGLTLHP